MRLPFPAAAIAALLLVPAAAHADCRAKAIGILEASSPDGAAIYRQASPDFFAGWIDCAEAEYGLPTAVHESTHYVTGETDAFPLVGGGAVPRPHEVSGFMPPWRIARQFGHDSFVDIYLARGRASSATDVLYLLDELNAYTHDLSAAVDLKALRSHDEVVDHRDGLAALMAFTAAYAETAREKEPATWQGLQAPGARAAVATLWAQAERVMAASCGIPNYGAEDKAYLGRVCAAGPGSAMAELVGHAPACPVACLAPDVADAGPDEAPEPVRQDAPDDAVTGSLSRHPFAIAAGPRHHRPARDVGLSARKQPAAGDRPQ
jgi:hypothetical protein